MSDKVTPAPAPTPETAWGRIIISVVVLLAYAGAHALAVLKLLPDTVLVGLVSSDGTLAAAIVYFWVGSSNSSQRKDDTIAKAIARNPSTPP